MIAQFLVHDIFLHIIVSQDSRNGIVRFRVKIDYFLLKIPKNLNSLELPQNYH